jgi:SAM-dependent methyltransferase
MNPWALTVLDRMGDRLGKRGGGSPCPACDAGSSRHLFDARGVAILYCPACDLAFADPLPTPQELIDFYSDDAYFQGGHEGYGFCDQVTVGDRLLPDLLASWPFLDRLDEWLPDRGRLLDIGCGTGFRLSVASARGWQAEGIEPSEFASQVAREHYGQTCHTGRLDNTPYKDGGFDAVVLHAVIEHVTNPRGLMCEAARLLRPGGVIALQTPNYGSRRVKLRGSNWNEIRPPEHIVMHSERSLGRLADGADLDVIAFSTHPRYTVSPSEVRGCLPGPLGKWVDRLDRTPIGLPLQESLLAAYNRLWQYPILACWFRKRS